MLLVNLLWLLFFARQTFQENKGMQPITCSIIICLQNNIDEQGFTFFAISQKPIISSTCKPETKLRVVLVGLLCFMSICVDVPVKINVTKFSNQQ